MSLKVKSLKFVSSKPTKIKYHINSHGVADVCNARKKPCPLGGDDLHFDTFKEAQDKADELNRERYSILSQIEKETDRRLRIESSPFYKTLKSVEPAEEIHDYTTTYHFEIERKKRRRLNEKIAPENNVLATFIIDDGRKSPMRCQVYDSGLIRIYAPNDDIAVTEYLASRNKLEAIFHKANVPASEEFLETADKNAKEFKTSFKELTASAKKKSQDEKAKSEANKQARMKAHEELIAKQKREAAERKAERARKHEELLKEQQENKRKRLDEEQKERERLESVYKKEHDNIILGDDD